jgi:hypothetical protein
MTGEYKKKWSESKCQLKEVIQECCLLKDLVGRLKDELK